MFDVLGVDADFVVDGLELVGARSEHLRDDVQFLPWRRELVAVVVALDEAEYQVPDVEGPPPHPMAMVPAQHLLVLSRAEEGSVARIVELIHGILEGRLGSLLVVCPNPRCSIVEVDWEDGFRAVDHEKWHVTGCPVAGCP